MIWSWLIAEIILMQRSPTASILLQRRKRETARSEKTCKLPICFISEWHHNVKFKNLLSKQCLIVVLCVGNSVFNFLAHNLLTDFPLAYQKKQHKEQWKLVTTNGNLSLEHLTLINYILRKRERESDRERRNYANSVWYANTVIWVLHDCNSQVNALC